MRKDENELTPEEQQEKVEQKADELREDGVSAKRSGQEELFIEAQGLLKEAEDLAIKFLEVYKQLNHPHKDQIALLIGTWNPIAGKGVNGSAGNKIVVLGMIDEMRTTQQARVADASKMEMIGNMLFKGKENNGPKS